MTQPIPSADELGLQESVVLTVRSNLRTRAQELEGLARAAQADAERLARESGEKTRAAHDLRQEATELRRLAELTARTRNQVAAETTS